MIRGALDDRVLEALAFGFESSEGPARELFREQLLSELRKSPSLARVFGRLLAGESSNSRLGRLGREYLESIPTAEMDVDKGEHVVDAEPSPDRRKVFVVHGRDDRMRREVFTFLRSVGLEPIEWANAMALTGKTSPYVGEILDAAFGAAQAIVVLQTPDELAYLRPSLTDDVREAAIGAQPRPNVLFEAGMAFGRDPDRTILVEVGELRDLSDVHGRHVLRLKNTPQSHQEFANRLATAKCQVNREGTDWLSSGDFSAPEIPGTDLR